MGLKPYIKYCFIYLIKALKYILNRQRNGDIEQLRKDEKGNVIGKI